MSDENGSINPGQVWITVEEAALRVRRKPETIRDWAEKHYLAIRHGRVDEHELMMAQRQATQAARDRGRRSLQVRAENRNLTPLFGASRHDEARFCELTPPDGGQCQNPVHPDSPVAACWRHLELAARFVIDVTAPAGGLDHAFQNLICPHCRTQSVTAMAAFPECWCARCKRQLDREECEQATGKWRLGVLAVAEKLLAEHRLKADQPCVYFVRFGDRVKIGTTKNPTTRFANLPIDEVLAIFPGDARTERALHARFRALRVNGEWFRDDPDIRQFIAAAKRNQQRAAVGTQRLPSE